MLAESDKIDLILIFSASTLVVALIILMQVI